MKRSLARPGIWATLTLAALTLSPCAWQAEARATTPAITSGGTLRTAFDAPLSTMDPAVGYDAYTWTGEHAVFDGLLDYSSGTGLAGTQLVPRLAASMPTVSKDGLTYTFQLRHGVRFQPPLNREVTADDVKYSIERALSPRTPKAQMVGSSFWSSLQGVSDFWNKKAQHISGITVSGKYGITFKLTTPDRAFLNVLAMPFTSVVPHEWVDKYKDKFSEHPLGTGPFMVDSKDTVPGTRLVLVRNPNYFRKGLPYLDKVIIDFNVADHLQIQRVQAGALDLAGNLVTSDDFLSLKNDPKWSRYLAYAPDIAVTYLAFNLKQKPFEGNLKLRQAINMAINKQQILKLINGRGVIMQGILPPTMPGADPKFSYYPYDPQKARALLAAAGYGPNKLSIPLTYQQSGDFDKIAQEIQAELKEIGISIVLKPVSTDTWYGSVAYTQKEGPMVLAPWGQDYPDPSDFFDPILTCNAGSNAAFYCNPALDALAAKARGNPNDQARIAQYHQMERMVMADAPWVPIYDDVLYDFHGPHLGGFYIHPVWPFNYAEYYMMP